MEQAAPVLVQPPADKSQAYLVIVEPYVSFYRYLQIAHRRFRTLVLSANPDDCLVRERKYSSSIGQPETSHIDRFIQCNTADVSAMCRALEPLRSEIAGVLAGHESSVAVATELGWSLGFDYAKPEDAITHRLKSAMRRRYQERGVPSPRFFVATTWEQAKQSWEDLGRDCMVKMVDADSSMNIFRPTTLNELESAWDIIINNRRNIKSLIPLSKEVVLEEFVSGRELTVEGYTQGDRVVCLNFSEKITESSFVVVGHLIPAVLSSNEEEILSRLADQVVRAEGMRNSVFHVEIHLQDDTPYVIECTSRPPGQNASEVIYRSHGCDLMDIAVSLAVGEPVFDQLNPPKKHFAMLALYSQREGIFEKLEGEEELRRRGGLFHLHLGVKPGDRIEPLSTFHQRYGFVILEDDTAEGVREKAGWTRTHLRLALKN
jgi:biotin carboxylase